MYFKLLLCASETQKLVHASFKEFRLCDANTAVAAREALKMVWVVPVDSVASGNRTLTLKTLLGNLEETLAAKWFPLLLLYRAILSGKGFLTATAGEAICMVEF